MPAKPMDVSMLNPLQLPVGKDVLRAIVEDTIRAIEANRGIETPDDAFETELMLAQRREFLAWVAEQPGPNVSIALYPLVDAAQGPSVFGGLLS